MYAERRAYIPVRALRLTLQSLAEAEENGENSGVRVARTARSIQVAADERADEFRSDMKMSKRGLLEP